MIPSFLEYSATEWAFPKRDIAPRTKDGEYCRRNAAAIYSLFLRGKMSWSLPNMNDFYNWRLYSRGDQSTEKYKSWLTGDAAKDTNGASINSFDDTALSRVAKREGWSNIMFQNVSPAPQIMTAIHGMLDKLDYDCYCDTIDSNSTALKEEQKYIKLCEAQNASWQVEYKKNAGIPVDEDVVFPKSTEELAMLEAKDGFKLNVARAMQKLVRHSFNISDWDGTIRKKVLDDLICLGYGAVRDYFDTRDHKWKVEYLDPARLVMQYSNEYDYKDSEYFGYFKYETISNLRNKLPNIKENQLSALARACYTLYGNVGDRWSNFYSLLDPTTNTYRYDGFKVPVFICEWMDTDTENKLYYTSVRGRESIIPLDFGADVRELSKEKKQAGASQEVKPVFKRLVRQCTWVLNTDYVYDYGVVKMASREGLSTPQLSAHVEQLLAGSMIKNIVPILDQICNMFLRWQNSLAMMIERGYAINTSMLANVTFGGNKLKPAEVLKLWQQTGRLLYSYGNTPTGLYSGGAALPVVPIDGGLGTRVDETMKALQMMFWQLEQIMGFKLINLDNAVSPNGGDSKNTPESQSQATLNLINPYLHAIFEIKSSAGTSMMRRLQIGLRNSAKIKEAYIGVIAPNDMNAMIEMEADGVQYGLSLKAKPDAKQKARFENWINIALQNTREQRPGADLPDVMHFMTQLEQGADMNDLVEQLSYIIQKAKQESLKNSQDAIKLQAQTNMQAQQAKDQSAAGLIQAEGQVKMQRESMVGNIKDSLLTKQFNMDFLKQLQAGADAEAGLNTKTPNGK